MGPKRYQRYNAKARSSSVGGSSHKGKKSMRQRQIIEADANAQIIDDATREALAQQDRQRRELLREGGNDETMKISSKKRKRLDKFIEAKLRKDEKARVLEKLAKSSADISDRTELVSAATLGTGRVTKEIERVNKLLGAQDSKPKRARSAAMTIHEDDLDEDLDAMDHNDDDQVTSETFNQVHEYPENDERQRRILDAVKKFEKKEAIPTSEPPVQVGSALARGIDDHPLQPVIRKRQRKRQVQDRSNLSIMERVVRGKSNVNQQRQDTDSSFDSDEDEEKSETSSSEGVYNVDKMIENRKMHKGKEKMTDYENDTDSVATDELESEEPDTDEDEEAVLLEAMRQRGLLPPGSEAIPENMLSNLQYPAEKRLGASKLKEDEEHGRSENDESDPSHDDENDDWDEEEEEEEEGDSSDEDEENENDHQRNIDFEVTHDRTPKRRGIGESSLSRGFKEWAMEALQLARPNQDNEDGRTLEPVGGHVVRVRDLGPQDGKIRGPLGQDMPSTRSSFTQQYFDEEAFFSTLGDTKPIRHVIVERPRELQEARMQLPVVSEEDSILRTVLENPVTVLCGETGSGKTTQVPQFLYEAGFGTHGSGMYDEAMKHAFSQYSQSRSDWDDAATSRCCRKYGASCGRGTTVTESSRFVSNPLRCHV